MSHKKQKQKHYYLSTEDYNGEIVYIDYSKAKGFKVTPKNQIKYDGVMVNQMVIINPSFIEKVLKRKIKRKLDSYLQYILQVLEMIENGEDEDGSLIEIVLNDLDRYRRTIMNNYREFLEQRYVELLMKKIALLERELRIKEVYLTPLVDENEKTTGRRSR